MLFGFQLDMQNCATQRCALINCQRVQTLRTVDSQMKGKREVDPAECVALLSKAKLEISQASQFFTRLSKLPERALTEKSLKPKRLTAHVDFCFQTRGQCDQALVRAKGLVAKAQVCCLRPERMCCEDVTRCAQSCWPRHCCMNSMLLGTQGSLCTLALPMLRTEPRIKCQPICMLAQC